MHEYREPSKEVNKPFLEGLAKNGFTKSLILSLLLSLPLQEGISSQEQKGFRSASGQNVEQIKNGERQVLASFEAKDGHGLVYYLKEGLKEKFNLPEEAARRIAFRWMVEQGVIFKDGVDDEGLFIAGIQDRLSHGESPEDIYENTQLESKLLMKGAKIDIQTDGKNVYIVIDVDGKKQFIVVPNGYEQCEKVVQMQEISEKFINNLSGIYKDLARRCFEELIRLGRTYKVVKFVGGHVIISYGSDGDLYVTIKRNDFRLRRRDTLAMRENGSVDLFSRESIGEGDIIMSTSPYDKEYLSLYILSIL